MKYWVFEDGDVKGPFLPQELGERESFGPHSLVCPENKGDDGTAWKEAHLYDADFNFEEATATFETPLLSDVDRKDVFEKELNTLLEEKSPIISPEEPLPEETAENLHFPAHAPAKPGPIEDYFNNIKGEDLGNILGIPDPNENSDMNLARALEKQFSQTQPPETDGNNSLSAEEDPFNAFTAKEDLTENSSPANSLDIVEPNGNSVPVVLAGTPEKDKHPKYRIHKKENKEQEAAEKSLAAAVPPPPVSTKPEEGNFPLGEKEPALAEINLNESPVKGKKVISATPEENLVLPDISVREPIIQLKDTVKGESLDIAVENLKPAAPERDRSSQQEVLVPSPKIEKTENLPIHKDVPSLSLEDAPVLSLSKEADSLIETKGTSKQDASFSVLQTPVIQPEPEITADVAGEKLSQVASWVAALKEGEDKTGQTAVSSGDEEKSSPKEEEARTVSAQEKSTSGVPSQEQNPANGGQLKQEASLQETPSGKNKPAGGKTEKTPAAPTPKEKENPALNQKPVAAAVQKKEEKESSAASAPEVKNISQQPPQQKEAAAVQAKPAEDGPVKQKESADGEKSSADSPAGKTQEKPSAVSAPKEEKSASSQEQKTPVVKAEKEEKSPVLEKDAQAVPFAGQPVAAGKATLETKKFENTTDKKTSLPDPVGEILGGTVRVKTAPEMKEPIKTVPPVKEPAPSQVQRQPAVKNTDDIDAFLHEKMQEKNTAASNRGKKKSVLVLFIIILLILAGGAWMLLNQSAVSGETAPAASPALTQEVGAVNELVPEAAPGLPSAQEVLAVPAAPAMPAEPVEPEASLEEKALQIVQNYELPNLNSKVSDYFDRIYRNKLTQGYNATWSAEPLHKDSYIVKYRLSKTRMEPIVYLFQVDVAHSQLVGALNNITLDLVGKIK